MLLQGGTQDDLISLEKEDAGGSAIQAELIPTHLGF